MSNALLKSEMAICARRIVSLGGRPELVQRITGMGQRTSREIYRAVNGTAAPTGKNPQPSLYVRDIESKHHTALYLAAKRAAEKRADHGEVMRVMVLIDAHEMYLAQCALIGISPVYTLHTSAKLADYIQEGRLHELTCSCGSPFVTNTSKSTLPSRAAKHFCPACELQKANFCKCGNRLSRYEISHGKSQCRECEPQPVRNAFIPDDRFLYV